MNIDENGRYCTTSSSREIIASGRGGGGQKYDKDDDLIFELAPEVKASEEVILHE